MSRCFPYPPPGYALSSATQDALIESIKLQKDKVKAEEHKKDKKREKKERKKDKKDKKDKKEKKEKKEKKDKKSQIKDSSDAVLSHLDSKFGADAKINFSQKEIKAESEQLERSSLTEEHAKPVCIRVPSSSSDSTENSNKRKRQPSPVDISRGHGKIIRIRLSSKKHSQFDALSNEEKQCSTSGRIHVTSQIENAIAAPRLRSEGFCSTSGSNGSIGQSLVFKTGGERFQIASKQVETVSPRPLLETKALPPVMTAMQKECLLYRNLIENWVPPQMNELLAETGDEDWLFGSKTKKAEGSETRRICRDESVSSCSASLWPRAQYLPEVDLYALPYTVPF